MEEIVSLVIPFIALSILSVMIDRFTLFLEKLISKIPNVPDKFEFIIGYITVFVVGYLVCWQLDFALFRYFGLDANFIELDYILTALILSGGSSFVRVSYSQIESIPSILSGVTSTIKKVTLTNGKTDIDNRQYKVNDNYNNEQIPYDLLDLDQNYNQNNQIKKGE